MNFPSNAKNGVAKRFSDESVKQFESAEFNIACKELALSHAIVVHGAHFSVYQAEYRGTTVAVKIVSVDEIRQIVELINTMVDLTALAALPHENVSAFYGAGCSFNVETQKQQVSSRQ